MSRTYITCTWSQVPHLDEKEKEEMFAALPPHQRDARSKGIPALGSGAIFPVNESEFVVKPFVIPHHYKHGFGMDVGWQNTAAVFFAVDPENNTVYLTGEYKRGQAEPAIHAAAILGRAKGKDKPGVIDPASRGRAQTDGAQLLQIYRQLGLNIIEADNSVESGLYKIWQMLSTGTFKVFNTCPMWLDEYRMYRRDEKGKVVKDNDHLMDSTRYYINSGIPLSTFDLGSKNNSGADPYRSRLNSVISWMGN